MNTLIIYSDNTNELQLIQYLAVKLGMSFNKISEEDKEDYSMLLAIQEGTKDDLVEEEEIFKMLRANET